MVHHNKTEAKHGSTIQRPEEVAAMATCVRVLFLVHTATEKTHESYINTTGGTYVCVCVRVHACPHVLHGMCARICANIEAEAAAEAVTAATYNFATYQASLI